MLADILLIIGLAIVVPVATLIPGYAKQMLSSYFDDAEFFGISWFISTVFLLCSIIYIFHLEGII